MHVDKYTVLTARPSCCCTKSFIDFQDNIGNPLYNFPQKVTVPIL